MTTYTVKAKRSGDWWALSVPQIKGVHSQARRLTQAESTARDAIALMLEVAPDSFDVDVEVELDAELDALVEASRRLQREAEVTRDEAAARTRAAVRAMLHAGLTQADAAEVMGVSPQRLSQLVGR